MAGWLLVVLAHPDDECMGTGGLILRHAAVGVQVRGHQPHVTVAGPPAKLTQRGLLEEFA